MSYDRELAGKITGYIGAFLLSILFIPQIIHTHKVKNIEGLSWYFVILNLVLTVDFLLYGIFIKEIPLILSQCTILVCAIIMAIQYKIYGKKKDKIQIIEV